MKSLRLILSSMLVATVVAPLGACTETDHEDGEDLDGDGKADGTASGVSADNLNGLWDGKLGTKKVNDLVIRSWPSVGIELELDGKTYELTRSGNKLTGEGITLDIKPNERGQRDDAITGKVGTKTLTLKRDIEVKEQLTLELPKDRPYRIWLRDQLTPMAHADRESYVVLDAERIKDWMKSTVLFQAGSFQRKYMKGANRAAQDKEFLAMIDEMDGLETTPRAAISDPVFSKAVKDHLKDDSLTGLALVNFNLYFTTAAGRSIILPFDDETFAYFITDRPSRAQKLGLVVMDTPAHGPLASTFGRQLLDLGEMAANDNVDYATAMMELLTQSDPSGVSKLDKWGKSALVDWFAVMAIEDYRGTAFGNPNLGWGYNITNTQFYGLVARALGGQVIVGTELRPGDPSYADVLNSGNDLQEYQDMTKLKKLATDYLRASHAAVVTEVEASLKDIVPADELDSRAKSDVFHLICANMYDREGRMEGLTATKAERINRAVGNLVKTLGDNAAGFEAYILSQGITKSSEPAPKATGF
jgi:hypothetical protein